MAHWTHTANHVISLHHCGGGQALAGQELHLVRGAYLALLAAGEQDGNGNRGRDDAYWCLFSGDAVRAEPDGLRVTLQLGAARLCRSHFRTPGPEETAQLVAQFQRLQHCCQRPDLGSQYAALSELAGILAVWASPQPAAAAESAAVRQYRALIEQAAWDSASSLTQLAATLHMTADHLAILFRRDFGLKPVEYRTRLRLARARELLLSTTLSVAEISTLAGFRDASYFCRVFQATHRCSPRDYARRHQMRAALPETPVRPRSRHTGGA